MKLSRSFNQGGRLTNPREHGSETIRNQFIPLGINVCLVFTPDMFWIGGFVGGAVGYTVREFRDPASHETVNVI